MAVLGSSVSDCKHFEHVFKGAWETGTWSFAFVFICYSKEHEGLFHAFPMEYNAFEILIQGRLQPLAIWPGYKTSQKKTNVKKIIDEAGKKKRQWQHVVRFWHTGCSELKKIQRQSCVCLMDDVDAESPFEEKPFIPYYALYTSYFTN